MGKWNGLTLPPYLTQQEFQRVQELRRRVTRKSPYNRIYLFSGLTLCGECGRRMTGHPTTLKDGTCVYKYLCQGAKQRRGCDNGLVVREQDIENYLMSSIDEQIQIKLKAKAQHSPKINPDAQIKAIQKKLAKLSELYIDDMISKPDYSKKYAELTEQVEALKQTQVQRRPLLPKRLHQKLGLRISSNLQNKLRTYTMSFNQILQKQMGTSVPIHSERNIQTPR